MDPWRKGWIFRLRIFGERKKKNTKRVRERKESWGLWLLRKMKSGLAFGFHLFMYFGSNGLLGRAHEMG